MVAATAFHMANGRANVRVNVVGGMTFVVHGRGGGSG